MGYEIPASFFEDLTDIEPVGVSAPPRAAWTPVGSMKWYDQIVDDILANPGTNLTECAKRLGRSPHTVQAIARSDLFKARWAQRRQAYEEALQARMVAKLTKTAELCLDSTIEVLQKKRDAIPLPILTELTKATLDRLGYGPSRDSGSAAVQVNVSTNVVSAEALASAREKLKLVEGTTSAALTRSVRPLGVTGEAGGVPPNNEVSDPKDPVAGQGPEDGEED